MNQSRGIYLVGFSASGKSTIAKLVGEKLNWPAYDLDEQIEAVLRHPGNRDEVQKAYAAAESRVAGLVQERGKGTVLGWLGGGIPGEVGGRSGGSGVASHD